MATGYRVRGARYYYCATENGSYTELLGVHEGDTPTVRTGTFDRTAIGDSGNARNKGIGEDEPGTTNWMFEYDPDVFEALSACKAAQAASGTVYWWKVIFPKKPGVQTVGGDSFKQQGIITELTVRRLTQAANEMLMGSIGLEWTGDRTWTKGS